MEYNLGKYVLKAPVAADERFSMLLWGESGAGKTTLASTAPKDILVINFDDGGQTSVVGVEGIFSLDLSREVDAISERMKESDPLGITKFLKENENFRTIVVDSLTSYVDKALAFAVSNGRIKNASMENPGLKGYQHRNAFALQLVRNLLRLTGSLNRNIIFIAHEAAPEKNDEGHVVSISLALGGQMSTTAPLQFSEVWAMADYNGQRKIAIRPCRFRKPMKTRMFQTTGAQEFDWKFNGDTRVGEGIEDWYLRWKEVGSKIPVPK